MVSVDQAFGTMPITMMVFLIQIPSYATTRVAMFHVYVVEIPLCALAWKSIFQHPILLLSYRPIKDITNHYETFFHLFVMNSLVFLIEPFFIWGTSRELIYYLDYFGASNTLVLYFAKIFILNHSYVIHIYD